MEHIGQIARRAFTVFGNREAVACKAVHYTFSQLEERAKRISAGFTAKGLAKGDRVAILMPNRPEFIELEVALAIHGLIKVPLNYRLAPRELDYMIHDSGAKLLIADSDLANRVQTDIPRIHVGAEYEDWLEQQQVNDFPLVVVSENDPFAILYTSGTTGRPKGVILSHRNMISSALGLMIACEMNEKDVMGHVAPLTHGSSFFIAASFILGINQVIFDKFEPQDFLQAIQSQGITTVFLVPTMVNLMIHEQNFSQFDLSGLRTINMAGAPMAAEKLKLALTMLGDKIVQTYGQVEAPMVITTMPRHEAPERLASCGREMMFSQMRIIDDTGKEVPPHTIGEVVCKGSLVMLGYWNNEQATAETLKDGWLHTGDLGYVDERGYLHLVDRKKDVIISGGSNIYPREVEEVLNLHPAVKETCVFGLPDDVWGEKVCVHIVLRDGETVTEEELLELCKEHLAGYKKPRLIKIVQALPKSSYGKILRKEIIASYGRNDA